MTSDADADADADDSVAGADFSAWRRLTRARARGPALVFAVAWLLYALARLTLMEAAQPSWWAFNAALLLGAIGLVVAPGRAAWGLAALGLAGPLFLFGDWLTQSFALLIVALVGVVLGHRHDAPSAAMCVHHRIAVAIYAMAVFHKLNTTFLDPAYSCALHGWSRLVEEIPALEVVALPPGFWAWATLAAELTLAGLVALAPRPALLGWALFHAPLTIALAPAFAFAVLPGILAAIDGRWLKELVRRRKTVLIGAALIAAAYLVLASSPSVIMALKLAVMAAVATASLVARPARATFDRRARQVAAVAVVVFVLNGLTPYAGTQFQHTGAMLSNLRIDRECFNHLVVPSDWPRFDPYVRIESASMGNEELGTIGLFVDYEQTLRETLWSPSALHRLRTNWCTPRTRPIALAFNYRGERHVVADLCDGSWSPPAEVGVWGSESWFGGWLRFQKNLPRACPAACVH